MHDTSRSDPRALAAAIAARHGLEGPLDHLTEGQTNHVFGTPEAVIRFSRDPLRGTVTDVDEFAKEAWCSRAAEAAGVVTPRVLAVGQFQTEGSGSGAAGADPLSVPYQLQERMRGEHPDEATPRLWQRLGDCAAALARIPLDDAPGQLFTRFGRDLAEAWAQHVHHNLVALGDDDPLFELGVYRASDLEWLTDWVSATKPVGQQHGLFHGDLNPGNVLVAPDGELVLLDWGSAATGPVPWGDLVHLQRGRFPHLAEDFAAGFGIDPEEVARGLPRLELLQALDLVRWAIDRRPDLLDHYRTTATQTVRRLAPR
ncbi:aminoglycoside phosphotransferase family protein [Aestuariimicrobium kwangyangense]|uniref:aminoglycoside phosphotransferase family protein n=1 Tax=Aestuariimicrobium kwangyangense TaxID=396389 RepID=UPI00040EEF17|nr:aminoglycoside phosphotransferase family protein [Aestuariimicrobium kwangyangense]